MAEYLHRIAAFIDAHPHGFPNVIDLPYRLSSWSLDDPANLRVWEHNGELQAVGMLQLPWLALDYAYTPAAESLVPDIFAWFAERAAALAHERNDELPVAIYLTPERAAHIQFAAALGFQRDDDWGLMHLERSLVAPIQVPALPAGFAFRRLDGRVADYVALHQAAFGSTNMRLGWRARTLTMSRYHPELDLLIVDTADDRPVAFCVGWLYDTTGQIEPLGVHPDYQRLGLGRAILLEGLRQLQVHGATQATIHVYQRNDPALALYQQPDHGGFQPSYAITGYVRTFGQAPGSG